MYVYDNSYDKKLFFDRYSCLNIFISSFSDAGWGICMYWKFVQYGPDDSIWLLPNDSGKVQLWKVVDTQGKPYLW